MQDLRYFIDRRLYRITGFLHPVDAMVLYGLAKLQRASGIVGGVAEIGVFYGRAFSLLAKTLQSGKERGLAIDLFDIGPLPSGGSQQLDAFNDAMRGEGIPVVDYEVYAGSSAAVTAELIKDRIGPVRVFSVDGGHERDDVDNDSALALNALHPAGVIAFDDFFNPSYPDVTCAVLDFMNRQDGGVRPFCITKNKLYVCRADVHAFYMKGMEELDLWAGGEKQKFAFLGDEVYHCTQSLANRVVYQKAAERGFGAIAAGLLRAPRHKFAR
jgi:methyltransferase family protein